MNNVAISPFMWLVYHFRLDKSSPKNFMIISVVARFLFKWCFPALCFHFLFLSYTVILHKYTLSTEFYSSGFYAVPFDIQVLLFLLFSTLSSFTSLYRYGALKYAVEVKLPCILKRMSECKGEGIATNLGSDLFPYSNRYLLNRASNK